MLNIKKVDHIGIIVKDLEKAKQFYINVLGLKQGQEDEYMPNYKCKIAFFPCGDTELELIAPTEADSVYGKYIEEYGEGIHHVAFKVDDIESALAEMKAKNIKLVDVVPKRGAANANIAFLHKDAAFGSSIELTQR